MRLIDADNLKYRLKYFDNYKGLSTEDIYRIIDDCDAVDTLVTLENATNGDMIKAMFPNARVDDTSEKFGQLSICMHDAKSVFSSDWWNAPYKQEDITNAHS